MKKIYIKIDGIHCNHCDDVISKRLKRITNIRDVTFDGSIALVSYVKEIDKNEIIKIITDLGYTTKEDDISYSKEVLDNKKRIKVGEFIRISLGIISISILIYKIFGFNIFGVIPTIDNDITYGVLFVTGLLTSIHCISMCGGINLMAVCNNEIVRQKFGIKQKLKEGINVIEFTPQEEGVITYTCWMNMIKNTIKVIDDIKYFKGE